jgi:hypothetical protein
MATNSTSTNGQSYTSTAQAYSLDIKTLQEQIQAQIPVDQTSEATVSVNTSVFTVGKDPRISTNQVGTPTLTNLEILKDGLQNPYIQLNWTVDRKDVDNGNIIAFQIFRRPIRDLSQINTFIPPFKYTKSDLEKLSSKKPTGKFSSNKPPNNVNSKLIDPSVLNINLDQIQSAQQNNKVYQDIQNNNSFLSSVNNFFEQYNATIIATVDYSQFLAQQKRSFLFVQDNNVATLYFRDTSVKYGDCYEYSVKTITKMLGQENSSNTISVLIQDFSPVSAPSAVNINQISETELQIVAHFDIGDKPSQALFYRKASTDVDFVLIGVADLTKGSVLITDTRNSIWRDL